MLALHHMCTVSIIPFVPPMPSLGFPHPPSHAIAAASRRLGFRLVTNRDELRTRPPAADPRWHDFTTPIPPTSGSSDADPARAVRAIYPVDPAGGGTWVAGSTSGLVLCILNANPIPPATLPPASELISRGVIIPELLRYAGETRRVIDVLRLLERLDLPRFAPFRLIGVAPNGSPDAQGFLAIEASWNRSELTFHEHAPGPACFVSSGLGDPLVKPRITLFNEMVRATRGTLSDLAGEQDRFHRHTWADRPEISVMMSRREARTVSITTVEVCRTATAGPAAYDLTLEYEPILDVGMPVAHAAPAGKHKVTLPARVARQAR